MIHTVEKNNIKKIFLFIYFLHWISFLIISCDNDQKLHFWAYDSKTIKQKC